MLTKKICCFHLLNDYSGSPQVLSTVLSMMTQMGYNVRLNTSKTKGFLSGIEGVKTDTTIYRWKRKEFRQVVLLLLTQIQIFIKSLFCYRKYDIFYINTILPFGAAIAGKLLGKKIVYHVHEKYVTPNLMQRFAAWVMKCTATQVIFVSNYLQQQYLDFYKAKTAVIYNCLPKTFIATADAYVQQCKTEKNNSPTVLMISSLKEFKGVFQFALLAQRLPKINFCLVVNASIEEVELFQQTYGVSNLSVYSSQSDVYLFYQQAHLLMNLSLPQLWIETFGLTLLEGMRYGLPIIAPTVGGPIELVQDGLNGFLVNAENLDLLQEKILQILEDKDLYSRFSYESLQRAKLFDQNVMYRQIETILNEV